MIIIIKYRVINAQQFRCLLTEINIFQITTSCKA
jgi:hypothetical protein